MVYVLFCPSFALQDRASSFELYSDSSKYLVWARVERRIGPKAASS
jgi:hypothetical protein